MIVLYVLGYFNRNKQNSSAALIIVFEFRVSGFKWVRSAWALQVYATSVEGGGAGVVIKHSSVMCGLVGSSKN